MREVFGYNLGSRDNAKARVTSTRPLGHTGLKEAVQPYESFYTIPVPFATSKYAKFGGAIMATSKMQRAFSLALSIHFGGYTIRENSRPAWCLGDNFERLELDFLIEELDVAVEIQGQQHYQYTPLFHASYDAFKAQQARDEAKKIRCAEYGITLIEVDDELTFSEALEKIRVIAKINKPRQRSLEPHEWRERLTQINKNLQSHFQSRNNMSYGDYSNRLYKIQEKINLCLKEYGALGVDYIDPNLALNMFATLQKSVNYAVSWKKRIRGQKLNRKNNFRQQKGGAK